MTRAFTRDPIDPAVVDDLVDLASRSPSAGKTQGWHVIVLEGPDQVARYWDITLPDERRDTFAWPGLLDAPVIALALADSTAYLERYSEPDKSWTGLGAGTDAWPAPYWTMDASMAVMTIAANGRPGAPHIQHDSPSGRAQRTSSWPVRQR